MTIKIHMFTNSFSHVASIPVTMTNTTGMTVSHYVSSSKATEATIPFEFEGVDGFVPQIEEVEFCAVIRKKVNMTAVGPNEKTIKDIGQDIGKYKYIDNVPSRPLDLPPGFKELYRN